MQIGPDNFVKNKEENESPFLLGSLIRSRNCFEVGIEVLFQEGVRFGY
jgi:hypothetical protein